MYKFDMNVNQDESKDGVEVVVTTEDIINQDQRNDYNNDDVDDDQKTKKQIFVHANINF